MRLSGGSSWWSPRDEQVAAIEPRERSLVELAMQGVDLVQRVCGVLRSDATNSGAVIAMAEKRVPGFAPLIVLLAYTGMRVREAWACAGRTSTSTRPFCVCAGSSPWTTGRSCRPRPTRVHATFRSSPRFGAA
jgi:hypothetical protein